MSIVEVYYFAATNLQIGEEKTFELDRRPHTWAIYILVGGLFLYERRRMQFEPAVSGTKLTLRRLA